MLSLAAVTATAAFQASQTFHSAVVFAVLIGLFLLGLAVGFVASRS